MTLKIGTALRAERLGREHSLLLDLNNTTAQFAAQVTLAIFGFKIAPTNRRGVRTATHVGGPILTNISFELESGTVTCLAGPSGSGKTTLLRILSGAMPPTTGRVEIRGRTSSLLDVGENLESATALQNIHQELQYRRVDEKEHKKFVDEVIAFAGLKGFENVDVARYSSGMRLRLSMALALHSDASVFLLDDVLGVGDIGFQQQCVRRLLQLKAEGRTMLIVLSDDALTKQLADRVIELHGGQIVGDGPPKSFLEKDEVQHRGELEWHKSHLLPENEFIALKGFEVDVVEDGDDAALILDIEWRVKIAPLRVRPHIDVCRGNVTIYRSLYPQYESYDEPQDARCSVRVPLNDLRSGDYRIDINAAGSFAEQIFALKARNSVHVKLNRADSGRDDNGDSAGLIAPALAWDCEVLQEAAGDV